VRHSVHTLKEGRGRTTLSLSDAITHLNARRIPEARHWLKWGIVLAIILAIAILLSSRLAYGIWRVL